VVQWAVLMVGGHDDVIILMLTQQQRLGWDGRVMGGRAILANGRGEWPWRANMLLHMSRSTFYVTNYISVTHLLPVLDLVIKAQLRREFSRRR